MDSVTDPIMSNELIDEDLSHVLGHIRGKWEQFNPLIMLKKKVFATYCFPPVFVIYFFKSFSSRIAYHSPGITCMKMPLGMDDPFGQ